jgi:hypothetical protein
MLVKNECNANKIRVKVIMYQLFMNKKKIALHIRSSTWTGTAITTLLQNN